MRLNAYEQRFVLADRDLRRADRSPVRYDDLANEMVAQVSPDQMYDTLYWQLPQEVTGNKLGAYGGNLTVIQRIVTGNRGALPYSEHEIVLEGGGLTLTSNMGVPRPSESEEMFYKVAMLESAWQVGEPGRQMPASREDILKALSNIEVS